MKRLYFVIVLLRTDNCFTLHTAAQYRPGMVCFPNLHGDCPSPLLYISSLHLPPDNVQREYHRAKNMAKEHEIQYHTRDKRKSVRKCETVLFQRQKNCEYSYHYNNMRLLLQNCIPHVTYRPSFGHYLLYVPCYMLQVVAVPTVQPSSYQYRKIMNRKNNKSIEVSLFIIF